MLKAAFLLIGIIAALCGIVYFIISSFAAGMSDGMPVSTATTYYGCAFVIVVGVALIVMSYWV